MEEDKVKKFIETRDEKILEECTKAQLQQVANHFGIRLRMTKVAEHSGIILGDKAEAKGLGDDDDDDDDDVWQPSIPMKRAPKSARKPKGNKSRSQVPNPHLKDQENKSSVANKADDTQLPQDSSERTGVQRRKRQLYKSAVCEPYQGSPNLAEPPTAVDSPHSIVRRQLRNKNK
ncbi:uncharacterized protein [Procambarus clarkii]|uniref:uncharacterized protein n=1 Tax=Procambarus clarkii TaxID=6728 RepID=UPI003743557C